MDIRQQIMDLFEANELEEAASKARSIEASDTAWAATVLGRIAWKQGNKAEAISQYARAAALEPDGPAAQLLAQARAIMDFYNHDLYNP